jgi:TolB-like protein
LSIFNELKRRNVFRIGAAYVVGAWLLIQVAETIFPLFGFGDTPARLVVVALAIGFIPSLILSWVFEITPEGLKKDADVDYEKSISQTTGRKLDRIILIVLALALGYFAFDKFVLDPVEDAQIAQSARHEGRTDALAGSSGDKSIAVLPFANMSSDPEQEYFSDGITEEILNLLVKIPELKVTSRTSVFSFKGQNFDIPTVAKKLGVAHILEGSVRKAGERVRITTQLIEAGNDVHLWSETYERRLDDIFAIQDEIAREVVKALEVQLLGEAPLAAATNIESYKQYLKGNHFAASATNSEGLELSETAYREAIALDANFAPPWVGLANVLRTQGRLGFTELQVAMEASRQAAMRALELDDKLAEAWLALAEIQFDYDWDWSRAEVTTRIALTYGPQNAPVLRFASVVALTLGKVESALGLAQLAADLDPLDMPGLVGLAISYWATGQPEEEERVYRLIMELYPEGDFVKPFLAAALAVQGRPEEGLQYLDFDSEGQWHQSMSIIVLHILGRHEEEQSMRQKLVDKKGRSIPTVTAMTYAWHGDADKAFEWLDIAFEQRDALMVNLVYNPWLAPLHDDPRWVTILDKMGLLEYWTKSLDWHEEAESQAFSSNLNVALY